MYRNRLKGYKQLGYTIKPVSDSNQNETRPSKLYSTGDYKTDFIQDCLNAKKSVVICSPYLSKTEVQKFLPLVSKILSCGCKIFITTRVHEDAERRKKQQPYIDMLEMEEPSFQEKKILHKDLLFSMQKSYGTAVSIFSDIRKKKIAVFVFAMRKLRQL